MSNSPFAQDLLKKYKWYIIFSSFTGCLAIFFDYLHYFFGYRASEEASQNIRRYESLTQRDLVEFKLYDVTSTSYKARRAFFTLKHVCVFIGMSTFIFILLLSLFD